MFITLISILITLSIVVLTVNAMENVNNLMYKKAGAKLIIAIVIYIAYFGYLLN